MTNELAEQAVVDGGLVEVGGDGDREDRLQVRRPLDRGLELGHGEVADADHADVAVAPRLGGRPFDEVVHVPPLLPIEEAEHAARSAGAAQVGDDVHVAARDEEVAGAGLDEAHRRAEVLDLTRIGRGRDQRGIAAGRRGAVDVRQQRNSVAQADGHVIVARHRVRWSGQIAIGPARRLRPVELALAGTRSCNRHENSRSLLAAQHCTSCAASRKSRFPQCCFEARAPCGRCQANGRVAPRPLGLTAPRRSRSRHRTGRATTARAEISVPARRPESSGHKPR